MKLVKRIDDDEVRQGNDGEQEEKESDYRWEYREGEE
jgi:hypothetical protein